MSNNIQNQRFLRAIELIKTGASISAEDIADLGQLLVIAIEKEKLSYDEVINVMSDISFPDDILNSREHYKLRSLLEFLAEKGYGDFVWSIIKEKIIIPLDMNFGSRIIFSIVKNTSLGLEIWDKVKSFYEPGMITDTVQLYILFELFEQGLSREIIIDAIPKISLENARDPDVKKMLVEI